MKIQIKNRFSGNVIFETDAETIGDAVKAALVARADLSRANLSRANLSRENLSRADLSGANLSGANLSRADLSRADLSRANLSSADLSSADLSGADLSCANLSRANLSGADLSRADLQEIKISKENLSAILSVRTIVADGEIIGWKKLLGGVVCKLKIPSDAKRVGGLSGRKCRAEFAIVLDGEGMSKRGGEYEKGKRIEPDKFDPNPLVECSHGIHFFITRAEAEDYRI